MKFELGKSKTPKRKTGYYLDIKTMAGDCRYYNFFQFGPFSIEERPLLEEIITVLQSIKNRNPDNYEQVKNFNKWFNTIDEEQLTDDLIPLLNGFEIWPGDDYGNRHSFDSYSITYVDCDGVEFDVIVK